MYEIFNYFWYLRNLPLIYEYESLSTLAVRQNERIITKESVSFAPVPYVATAMAGMIYPAVIGAPPLRAMMPFLIPEHAPATRENQQLPNDKCLDRKRPASQATSVKAEPGSIMAMSESSKKVKQPLRS